MDQMQPIEKLMQHLYVVPQFFPRVRLHVIPSALGLLRQIGEHSLRKAVLKVCETANRNMRETLEAHNDAHREETRRRAKCQQTYNRTFITTKLR